MDSISCRLSFHPRSRASPQKSARPYHVWAIWKCRMSDSSSVETYRRYRDEYRLASRVREPIEIESRNPCKRREGKHGLYLSVIWEFAAALGQLFFLHSRLFEIRCVRVRLNPLAIFISSAIHIIM